MHILHISQYCHAGSIGGTERYILDLIRGLKKHGLRSSIGWLWSDARRVFESEGITVYPLPPSLMRVDEPAVTLTPAVKTLLNDLRPDLLHFHTFGLAEANIARIAAQRAIPYVFTYHSPGWTCRREDLLIWSGKRPCDGEVRTLRCAACKVQERFGGPAALSYAGAILSLPLDLIFKRSSRANFRRRVCFLSDTRRYRQRLGEFLGACSLVVSCSGWGMPVLLANGASGERLRIIPQGVSLDFTAAAEQNSSHRRDRQSKTPFTVGYIGRVTSVKGVHILAEGFSRVQGDDIQLKIYGFVKDENTVAVLNQKLLLLARRDRRIQLHPKLAFTEMMTAYSGLDLVAIPSIGPETGPLVLFEALRMGTPVYGSNRIGHLNLLRQFGEVVEPNMAEGWHKALSGAVEKHRDGRWTQSGADLPSNLTVRSMTDVVREMVDGYQAAFELPANVELQ